MTEFEEEEQAIKRIAEAFNKRTGKINQIGSVSKILKALWPEITAEFDCRQPQPSVCKETSHENS